MSSILCPWRNGTPCKADQAGGPWAVAVARNGSPGAGGRSQRGSGPPLPPSSPPSSPPPPPPFPPLGFCAAVEATRLEPRSHFRNWPSWIASVPMRGAKRTEPRWALRQKARARPEGAAIHQKDTIIGVFLLGANRSPTSAGSPEIKKPRRVSGAPGLSVRGLYVE